MRVNCSRFYRNKEGQIPAQKPFKGDPMNHKQAMHQPGRMGTYADVVSGGRKKMVWKKKGSQQEVWRGMEFNVKEEDMDWLNSCYVGYVNKPSEVCLLQERLIDEGVVSFKVSPMGGEMVLIKPSEEEVFEDFVKENEESLEVWFHDIRGWSPMISTERNVWVKCQGAPLHVWTQQFFEMIVGCLGNFVSLDSNILKNSYEAARILIRTSSWEFINRIIKVRINGLFYNIRLLKEVYPVGLSSSQGDAMEGARNSHSSSSSETWSLSNFSVGTMMGSANGVEEEELFVEE